MKVILHIGTEKTGTSSIQEVLLQNKFELAKQGFFYLHMNGRNEYRDFPAYCMRKDRVDDYFRRLRVTNEKERGEFDKNFLSHYRQKIESIPESIHTVVISSEHFSSRLRSIDEVCRVRSLLEQDFNSVQVICYLRDQLAKICSGYSTRIKSGGCISFNEYFDNYINKNVRDEYDKNLALWEEVFGYNNINVKLFDRASFPKGSLLRGFFNILNESLFDQLNIPALRLNQALSHRGCDLMRRVNYLFPERIRGNPVIENAHGVFVKMIARFVRGGPVRLNAEQSQQISQRFGSSNERTRARYFPSRSELFGNEV